jgi:hypothetical protein
MAGSPPEGGVMERISAIADGLSPREDERGRHRKRRSGRKSLEPVL